MVLIHTISAPSSRLSPSISPQGCGEAVALSSRGAAPLAMQQEEECEDEDAATRVSAPVAVYYYTDGAGQPAKGPCTIAQLRVLWVSGHIHGATPIWREGLSSWATIAEVTEVFTHLSSLAQPPPPPSDLWYYLDAGGRQRGGVTPEQLGMLLRRGEVDGLTSLWRQGMASWQGLGSIDELRTVLMQDNDDEDDDEAVERAAALEHAAQMAYDPDDDLGWPPRAASKDAKIRGLAAELATTAVASISVASSSAGAGAVGADGVAVALANGAPAADGAKPKRNRSKKSKFKADGGCNVYVNGLTEDVTEDELAGCFKVAGLLKTDPASGAPRIRIYRTPEGYSKGDALVSFLKPESVALAVTLRDGYELRSGRRLSVQPAKFEKREGEVPKRESKETAMLRKRQRLLEQRALAEWEEGLGGGRRNATVILTGLFDEAAAAQADADFYANLKQDVQVECAKAGAVDRVTIFVGSERGAAAVRFKSIDDAERCVAMLHDRQFGQANVRCEIYDGVSDYRALAVQRAAAGAAGASEGSAAAGQESVEEQERKLDAFGQWLEAGSTDDEVAGDGEDD